MGGFFRMAKSDTKNPQHKRMGNQEKSALMYLIGAIVILVVVFLGMKVYSTYPEASYSDIKDLSGEYVEELSTLEKQLVDKYRECLDSKDMESWTAFSQEWISKIGMSKPDQFGLRLSNKSMELVNAANFMSRDLFQLWTEYNVAIEQGAPANPDTEKALLESIQNGHTFIKAALSK